MVRSVDTVVGHAPLVAVVMELCGAGGYHRHEPPGMLDLNGSDVSNILICDLLS